MECSFKVGDRVICVDDTYHYPMLTKGKEYIIRDVRPWKLWLRVPGVANSNIGVRLQGVKRPWPDVPFVCTRFKPVENKRRFVSAERFKHLLDIVKNPNKYEFGKKADSHEKVKAR